MTFLEEVCHLGVGFDVSFSQASLSVTLNFRLLLSHDGVLSAFKTASAYIPPMLMMALIHS